MQKRPGWVYGVGGTLIVAWLGLLTVGAVALSTWFVIRYARFGPIPGAKVLRPVDDLGGLTGERRRHDREGH